MNFGQNLYNWFLSNAQSLVLMAIVEEAVLQKYFKEYKLYKEKTYKLFPYIY